MFALERLVSIFKPGETFQSVFWKIVSESLPLVAIMDRKALWNSPYVERTEWS